MCWIWGCVRRLLVSPVALRLPRLRNLVCCSVLCSIAFEILGEGKTQTMTKKVLVIGAGERVLRLCPPLNVGVAEVDRAMDILEESVAAVWGGEEAGERQA